MKKRMKKIGNSVGVTFHKEEREINKIEVNDIFDIRLKKQKKENGNKRLLNRQKPFGHKEKGK